MSLLDDYARVTRLNPCPVCGKPDWCLVSRDGLTAICPRTESGRRIGDAGWLHVLSVKDGCFRPAPVRTKRVSMSWTLPFGELHETWYRETDSSRIESFAASLGPNISSESLRNLGAAWNGSAWAFPMFDPVRVSGIRLRFPDGAKRSVRGGREGLFIARSQPTNGTLFVCEGPTDTAALLSIGLWAIGRPSCTGGTNAVAAYIESSQPGRVVIVSDADEPGRRGAVRLACRIGTREVIAPPVGIKDARAWVNAGATPADFKAS